METAVARERPVNTSPGNEYTNATTKRLLEAHLTLNGLNILFVNHVKYLGVIFGKRIRWRPHIEIIKDKTFRIFIRI
jgi:hypothetical protein